MNSPEHFPESDWQADDPDRSMSIIGYALAAVSGSLFTVVCLGVGAWLRGAW